MSVFRGNRRKTHVVAGFPVMLPLRPDDQWGAKLNAAGQDAWWMKIGVIFTVIGAVAAATVFFVRTADGRGPDSSNPTSSAATSERPTNAPNPSETRASNERHLAELPLAQGGGVVKVIGSRDLSLPCGSGQSDDRYRQIEYELPAAYRSFTTLARAAGKADPDASVGVQVFVRAREEKSDRTREAARVVIPANESQPVTADITDARAILLRITCSVSALSVTLADPRIGR
jgi:hypothetical protein